MEKLHQFNYTSLKHYTELGSEDIALAEAAISALNNAYAPYSNFLVGAACRLENGMIKTGFNFENASYPLCLCAERSALAHCNSAEPGMLITKIVVTARSANVKDIVASPCGACRQVMVEVETKQNAPLELILIGSDSSAVIFKKASDLLPFSFTGKNL